NEELSIGDNMTIRLTVELKEGYEFCNTVECLVLNVLGEDVHANRVIADSTATKTYFIISYRVPAPENGIMIQSISREVAEPTVGEALAAELVPLDVGANRARRYDVEDFSWTPWDETVQNGHNYTLTVKYRAFPDYGFYEDSEFFINGKKATVTELETGKHGSVTVEYFFQLADPIVMNYVKASFDGKIGLAFFVDIPEWIREEEGAYVTLTQCGETVTRSISDVVAGGQGSDGFYRIALYMPAAYYRENVNMRFYNGSGQPLTIRGKSGADLTEIGVNYYLEKYVKAIKDSTDEKVRNLARALDDYGTAAQIYFNHYNEGDTLTLSNAIAGVQQSQLEGYRSTRTGELTTKIQSFGIVGSFEADCTLKINVNFSGDGKKKSGIKYYIQSEEGGELKPTTLHGNQENGYFLSVRNIPAAYLGKPYYFVIKDTKTGETYTMGCSMFTYVRATAFKQDMPEAFQNLAKALYLYGKAAEAYFSK
ncbi:MAG: hypothetical protein J6X14_07265, partial [Lachnospiraceae bacterium]|nr:hypothetical protein [Lachnospiraceae bacterium]